MKNNWLLSIGLGLIMGAMLMYGLTGMRDPDYHQATILANRGGSGYDIKQGSDGVDYVHCVIDGWWIIIGPNSINKYRLEKDHK